jgi:hypothetical protein
VLLTRVAARGEGALAPPHRDADRARMHQLLEARGELLAQRQGPEQLRGERVLCPRPGPGAGVRGILEPAVGVGDPVSVQVLDEVEPGSLGVAHRAHGTAGSGVPWPTAGDGGDF